MQERRTHKKFNLFTLLLCAGLLTVFLFTATKPVIVNADTTSEYTLQDSTVIGPWSDSYSYYNCYGYAIGRTDIFEEPGYFSNQGFSVTLSISAMASLVEDDLEALGYSNISATTEPPANPKSHQRLICIRKSESNHYFHFMKFDSNNWYHKPGNNAVLKYKYKPAVDKAWLHEYVDKNGIAIYGGFSYDSEIYYITYNLNITSQVTIGLDVWLRADNSSVGINLGNYAMPQRTVLYFTVYDNAWQEDLCYMEVGLPAGGEIWYLSDWLGWGTYLYFYAEINSYGYLDLMFSFNDPFDDRTQFYAHLTSIVLTYYG